MKPYEMHMPRGGEHLEEPWKVLAVAMLTTAIADLREMRRQGAVVGDRWAWGSYWPKQRSGWNAKIACFYNQTTAARELLEFFTRGTAEHLMELVGGVDSTAALSRLGFGKKNTKGKG